MNLVGVYSTLVIGVESKKYFFIIYSTIKWFHEPIWVPGLAAVGLAAGLVEVSAAVQVWQVVGFAGAGLVVDDLAVLGLEVLGEDALGLEGFDSAEFYKVSGTGRSRVQIVKWTLQYHTSFQIQIEICCHQTLNKMGGIKPAITNQQLQN